MKALVNQPAWRLLVSIAGLFLSTVLPCAAQRYQIVDLGTLAGDYSVASAINAGRQVAGYGSTLAFLWSPENGFQGLGTLGVDTSSYAYGINNAGQVVGTSKTDNGEFHAFLWCPDDAQMRDLGTLNGGRSFAYGVNDSGQVVGFSGFLYDERAVIWDGQGGIQEFARGYANAINALGQVAGAVVTTGPTTTDAFLWDPIAGLQDLGTLGGDFRWSRANAIDNHGRVVGVSSTSTRFHGFLWDPENGMQDLGTLYGDSFSQAFGINDDALIVGSVTTLGEMQYAVLWTDPATIIDLDTVIPPNAGWRLQEARAINPDGFIVGWGYHNDLAHAFLLIPQP